MVVISLSERVKNFDRWKDKFDAFESVRREFGIKVLGLVRGDDDNNLVTLTIKETRKGALHDYLTSRMFQEAMKDAGVISKPRIEIIEE